MGVDCIPHSQVAPWKGNGDDTVVWTCADPPWLSGMFAGTMDCTALGGTEVGCSVLGWPYMVVMGRETMGIPDISCFLLGGLDSVRGWLEMMAPADQQSSAGGSASSSSLISSGVWAKKQTGRSQDIPY